jgi:hypothetical protein
MADYSNSKKNTFGGFPQKVSKFNGENGTAGYARVEPMLSVDKFKKQFLFGIPLVHPYTKQVLDDDTLKDLLARATSRVETECKVDITQVQRTIRKDFDRTKYLQGYNQLDMGFKNMYSLEEVSIRAVNSAQTINGQYISNEAGNIDTDGTVFYQFPLEWVDLTYADRGLLHLVPLQTTFNSTGIVAGASSGPAAALFAVFSRLQWIPSFFYIRATFGFEENAVPGIINDIIGVTAALDVLSMLGPLYRFNSQSIGIDGISQGVSGPGNQIYALRAQELEAKRESIMDVLKAMWGKKVYMTNF